MTAIDRRSLLGAAAVATIGLALMPSAAESAPLTIGRSLGRNAEDLIEKTQVPPPDAAGAAAAGFAGGIGGVECVAGAECRRAYPRVDMGRAFPSPETKVREIHSRAEIRCVAPIPESTRGSEHAEAPKSIAS